MDKNLLNNLPLEPGVYIMKNKEDKVIYVGKAKVLKNRVKQYFQNTSSHTSKVRAMVSNIHSFEYIITDTEIEALILECNLIKKYKPYYNILLKDDKNFPYIKVTLNEDYPKLIFTRKMEKDGAKYYGPYTNAFAVRETIDLVSKLFKVPTCNFNFTRDMEKKRACLNSHINQCIAPCEHKISKEEYRKIIENVCMFLEGEHKELLKTLTTEMDEASNSLDFERAALLRDKISSIKQTEEKQKIISDRQADEDVVGFYRHDNKTFAEVFFIRMGRLVGRHSSIIDKTEASTEEQIASEFIKQFYSEATYIPKSIYLSFNSDEFSLLSDWLSLKTERKTEIKCPKRGDKVRLTDMAVKNAHQAAVNYLLKKSKAEKNVDKTLISFGELIGLTKIARRIEAYDISNTSGANNVGSMVVFSDGKPLKSAYRKFKIETATGNDDYKSMTEMIYRRFKHALEEERQIESGELSIDKAKFLPKPDLVLLDGGKGHVSAICELLEMLDEDVSVFGMVKDDKHKTRALINAQGEEVGIKRTSDIFFFISRLQDEVHRYAIDYHKKLRKKDITTSELLKIEGVGDASVKKLLRHFKTISKIKSARIEELKEVSGISAKQAENIFDFFNKTT